MSGTRAARAIAKPTIVVAVPGPPSCTAVGIACIEVVERRAVGSRSVRRKGPGAAELAGSEGRVSVVVRGSYPLLEYPEGAKLASGVTAVEGGPD